MLRSYQLVRLLTSLAARIVCGSTCRNVIKVTVLQKVITAYHQTCKFYMYCNTGFWNTKTPGRRTYTSLQHSFLKSAGERLPTCNGEPERQNVKSIKVRENPRHIHGVSKMFNLLFCHLFMPKVGFPCSNELQCYRLLLLITKIHSAPEMHVEQHGKVC